MAALNGIMLLPLTWYCYQMVDDTNEYRYACDMKDMSEGHFTLCRGLQIDQPVIVIKKWKIQFHLRTCDKKEIVLFPPNAVMCPNLPATVSACANATISEVPNTPVVTSEAPDTTAVISETPATVTVTWETHDAATTTTSEAPDTAIVISETPDAPATTTSEAPDAPATTTSEAPGTLGITSDTPATVVITPAAPDAPTATSEASDTVVAVTSRTTATTTSETPDTNATTTSETPDTNATTTSETPDTNATTTSESSTVSPNGDVTTAIIIAVGAFVGYAFIACILLHCKRRSQVPLSDPDNDDGDDLASGSDESEDELYREETWPKAIDALPSLKESTPQPLQGVDIELDSDRRSPIMTRSRTPNGRVSPLTASYS